MAAKKGAESSPLTFDLKADLIAVLDKYQKQLGVSKSEIIRFAISGFDYAGFAPAVEDHRQISVRLPLTQKTDLVKLAKSKKVSIGELLRAALEKLPTVPAKSGIEKAAPKPKVAKKAAKKVAKKAAKKAVKKVAAKKVAAKKKPAAKKAVAKKPAAKKAAKKVAKKPAVEKAAAKEPAKKKASAKKPAAKKAAPVKVAKKAAPAKVAKKKSAKKKKK